MKKYKRFNGFLSCIAKLCNHVENKNDECLVKKSHAEYAEFAEAHTLCLCLPSGWWRKCSVRLCVFLTDKMQVKLNVKMRRDDELERMQR